MAVLPLFSLLFTLVFSFSALNSLALSFLSGSEKSSFRAPVTLTSTLLPRWVPADQLCAFRKAQATSGNPAFVASPASGFSSAPQSAVSFIKYELPGHPRTVLDKGAGYLRRTKQAPQAVDSSFTNSALSTRFPGSAHRGETESDGAFQNFRAEAVALFPGQGAQTLGMGVEAARSCAEAKNLFRDASEVVHRDLLRLCEEGPEQELHQTEWAQPALLTASMAAVANWRQRMNPDSPSPSISACIGLSLGEYSALCFAGALSFTDAVHLTRQRGIFMQRAAEHHGGGMAAVLGLNREQILRLRDSVITTLRSSRQSPMSGPASEKGEGHAASLAAPDVCVVANYLCPGNYAISGSTRALDILEQIALKKTTPEEDKERGFPRAKRVVRLKVSGAFHSEMMQEAAEGLREALAKIELKRPQIPVVMNVDAGTHADPAVIKEKLMRQLTSSVLFDKSLQLLVDRGMREGFEFGPGGVLAGLMKKISQDVKVHQVP
ncbi:acyl transferase domain-containing protein [Cystoisospora suis]|uniref:Acyl transferase domain-containing protein n=1 Tax=Cystoisospora suis TaxID=483139 RepID=A0A2C6LC93_9APIC|nr:acyl transferase domain-containing protein [Cystoisospora suis]